MDRYVYANAILSKFSKKYTEHRKDLPIRPSEMGVLNIIVKREGKYTPMMLSELLEVSKPMVTSYVRDLEKKGFIYREESVEDGRSFFVMPTDKARELVKIVGENTNEYLKEIEETIGRDKFDELINTLEKANEILKR